jgi:hypothetical protein
MTGGIMQLLAYGNQNIYLNGNPSVTFFKKTFKTHTNFAMESIRVNLNRSDVNVMTSTTLKAKIGRHGDLIQQVYFVFELPDIVSSTEEAFRWVDNVGEALLDNYHVSVGGSIIDKQYGEYLHVMNNLTLSQERKSLYDKMVGNVPELTRPEMVDVSTGNIGTGFTLSQYPASDNARQMLSIKGRKIYVPLRFWFNQDSGQALPLVSLQYSDTEITVECRPVYQLYKVLEILDNNYPRYRAPDFRNPAHKLANFVSNEFSTYLVADGTLDIKAYLEVNYIFLDTPERKYLAYNPMQYLIEQTNRIEYPALTDNTFVNLTLQNPIKELIWVCKRDNIMDTNNWFDFMSESGGHIMRTARIMFNGLDRTSEKDSQYFNYVQPWQHHKGCHKDGIYLYSFSVHPEDYQPSGSVNASRINKFQLYLTTNKSLNANMKYGMTLYAINYNILRISSGLAGVVYAS